MHSEGVSHGRHFVFSRPRSLLPVLGLIFQVHGNQVLWRVRLPGQFEQLSAERGVPSGCPVFRCHRLPAERVQRG